MVNNIAMVACMLDDTQLVMLRLPVFQELPMVIQRGWPSNRKAVPEYLYPYFDIRDELTIEDELVFKGHQLVIPASLCWEIKAVTHASHIGVEACI